jgi:hypothetical protein
MKINISKELYNEAQQVVSDTNITLIEEKIELWARIGMAAEKMLTAVEIEEVLNGRARIVVEKPLSVTKG